MKKLFFLPLLLAATTLFADPKVETFDVKDGSVTATYVTAVTSKECQQASWTFFSGGILKNLGDMGSNNYAAVIRAKKSTEDVYPYLESSSIEGGIDSLWFTWNSNGNETGGTWNVKIYINDQQVAAVTGDGGPKAASPFKKFGIGNLNITGAFTIKFVNESPYEGTGNFMRFVIDDLSWMPKAAAGEKSTPSMEFAKSSLIKKLDAAAFTNTLTCNSDATPTFESSDPTVATVATNGEVTVLAVGTTTITASVAETDTYKPKSASYALRVVPTNFNLETFDGAINVTGNNTYVTTPTVCPASEATGIVWTTLLGSVRGTLGSYGSTNMAVAIRGKKSAEENHGYLLSDTIHGGIDALAFDWNSNGDESGRQHPWDIRIYINGDSVGSITNACSAKKNSGEEYRYTLENLHIAGDFTIKIVNMNDADDGTSNHYRWVMDNLEWYSYEAPAPAHVYSVAGAEALMGTSWNEREGNEMTLQEDGTYKLVRENVTLAASDYEYKVVIDHQWNNGEAAQNSVLNIAQAGIYDVTFTYDLNGPTTNATATLKEAIVVLPSIQIAGSFNSWGGEDLTAAEDKLTATITKTLTANTTYEFKMIIASNWTSSGKAFTRDDNSGVITGNSDNMTLAADRDGDYVFTWTYETNTLEITFPVASSLENTEVSNITKQLVNGQLIITIDGVRYDAQGQVIR